MPNLFKAIVFDLDGTLLNSLDDLANSMNSVLRSFNFPCHPVDDYRYFVGDGIEKLVKRTLPAGRLEDGLVASVMTQMKQEYGRRWHEASHPYRGIDNLLAGLKKKGLILAVLSNKPHEMTEKIVDYFFLRNTFDIVWGAKAEWPKKPSPVGALALTDRLNATPDEVLFIGDTKIDMQTAKSAGMFAVGVTWGFRTRRELVENGADFIASQPNQILSLLE